MRPSPKFYPGDKVLLVQSLDHNHTLICTVMSLTCYPNKDIYSLKILLDNKTFCLIHEIEEKFLEKYYE